MRFIAVYYLFNAALVVFSYSLIQREMPSRQGKSQQPLQTVDHLNRAITAFRLLDRNNRVVERCTDYIEYLVRVTERQKPVVQAQQEAGLDAVTQPLDAISPSAGLPDLNDFLKEDLELAQFFASGIFDVQNSYDGLVGGFQ